MAPTAASTSPNASDGRTNRRTNSVIATAISATAKAYSHSKDRRRVAAIDVARLTMTNTARAAATSSASAHVTVAIRPAQPPEMSDRSAATPTCSSHTDSGRGETRGEQPPLPGHHAGPLVSRKAGAEVIDHGQPEQRQQRARHNPQ